MMKHFEIGKVMLLLKLLLWKSSRTKVSESTSLIIVLPVMCVVLLLSVTGGRGGGSNLCIPPNTNLNFKNMKLLWIVWYKIVLCRADCCVVSLVFWQGTWARVPADRPHCVPGRAGAGQWRGGDGRQWWLRHGVGQAGWRAPGWPPGLHQANHYCHSLKWWHCPGHSRGGQYHQGKLLLPLHEHHSTFPIANCCWYISEWFLIFIFSLMPYCLQTACVLTLSLCFAMEVNIHHGEFIAQRVKMWFSFPSFARHYFASYYSYVYLTIMHHFLAHHKLPLYLHNLPFLNSNLRLRWQKWLSCIRV